MSDDSSKDSPGRVLQPCTQLSQLLSAQMPPARDVPAPRLPDLAVSLGNEEDDLLFSQVMILFLYLVNFFSIAYKYLFYVFFSSSVNTFIGVLYLQYVSYLLIC